MTAKPEFNRYGQLQDHTGTKTIFLSQGVETFYIFIYLHSSNILCNFHYIMYYLVYSSKVFINRQNVQININASPACFYLIVFVSTLVHRWRHHFKKLIIITTSCLWLEGFTGNDRLLGTSFHISNWILILLKIEQTFFKK